MWPGAGGGLVPSGEQRCLTSKRFKSHKEIMDTMPPPFSMPKRSPNWECSCDLLLFKLFVVCTIKIVPMMIMFFSLKN